MTCAFRITRDLLEVIHADLDRPHPEASERVGLLEVRQGSLTGTNVLILASTYVPVPDEDYIADPTVGARLRGAAIRHSVERVLCGAAGLLHVHRHDHRGPPRFSGIDRADIPRIVASWRTAAPQRPHGALLLSLDHCAPALWLPGARRFTPAVAVSIVGRPFRRYLASAP